MTFAPNRALTLSTPSTSTRQLVSSKLLSARSRALGGEGRVVRQEARVVHLEHPGTGS